jgi:hypothetical protein
MLLNCQHVGDKLINWSDSPKCRYSNIRHKSHLKNGLSVCPSVRPARKSSPWSRGRVNFFFYHLLRLAKLTQESEKKKLTFFFELTFSKKKIYFFWKKWQSDGQKIVTDFFFLSQNVELAKLPIFISYYYFFFYSYFSKLYILAKKKNRWRFFVHPIVTFSNFFFFFFF